ncbi:MAG: secretion protein [Synergistaceae bacterium]|nr:secretion protein [Synergistaceae bacterium]
MEKKNKSYKFIKNMLKVMIYTFCVIALFFCVNSSYAVSVRAEKGELKPIIEGIRVRQIGGNEVLLEIRGTKMTLPKVLPNTTSAITFEWSDIKFPVNTDKKDWWDEYGWNVIRIVPKKSNDWWQKYDYPLIQKIQVISEDMTGIKMNIIGEKPLKIKSIRGMEGSDLITLNLITENDIKPVTPAPPRAKPVGDPLGMNNKVTLELRDVSAREVFRMLANLRKLDLVLDSTVPDTPMTFSFNEANFSEVFAYMLRMNDLTYSLMGKTLVVGTSESIGKTLGKNKTKGYKVAYADLPKLPAILIGLVPLAKPPVIDERTRTLYVTATPEQHIEIEAIMNKVDHPGKQVMLQARLIEVNDNAVQDIQSFLSAVYNGWLFSYGAKGLGTEYLSSSGIAENILTSSSSGSANKIPSPGESIASIPVNAVNGAIRALDIGLTAMETDNKGKVLANPSVVALDGQKALIKLTHNYLYQSGVDDARNPKFTKEETGPTLEITPIIGRDGFLTLKLNISTGEIVGFRKTGSSETPETTKREVNTEIRVRNGELFVIGGLFQETKTKSVTRIPVLSSIPLLGELFKSRNDKHVKTEMAFIVVPYILDVPSGAAEVYDMPSRSLIQ